MPCVIEWLQKKYRSDSIPELFKLWLLVSSNYLLRSKTTLIDQINNVS